MPRMYQEVKIKKDLDIPRLKGKLRPIILAPVRKLIKPIIKDKLPVYIDPLPIKPILLEPIEPKLRDYVDPIIPEYIGDTDEQQEDVREELYKDPATDKSREPLTSYEDIPRTL